jgi:DNA sulfur modification protein DndD
LSRRLTNIDQTIGALKVRVVQLDQQIKEEQANLDKIAGKSIKARRLIARRDLAERGAELLAKILEQHQIDARKRIARLVNDVLEHTARRDYRFEFRENFAMDLTFPDGRPVPRSSGENQLITLAFIAALIRFSVERAEKHEELLIPGIVAPLVLDSPFGQLDAKYRVDTAEFVPKMASQIVLLVSSSQGDKAVMKALKPNVGKEYVLISENRGPRGAKSEDALVLDGLTIATSLFNCAKDLTRIEEVKHAYAQTR